MWDNMPNYIELIFGGDAPSKPLGAGQIAARTVAVFIIGVVVMRFGKSRMITRASALDALMGFTLGSLLGRGINGSASLSGTAVSCVVLVVLHWLITLLTCKYHWFGNLVKGREKLLIHDGQVQKEALRSTHMSMRDLIEQLRMHANTDDLSRIQSAYKERSGEVGIVKRRAEPRVVEVKIEPGVEVVRIELDA
jgi:uncharacterized membrane protein YcaP (DUF421 family)